MLLDNSFGQRLQETFSDHGQLCVGLDPSSEQLTKWGLEDSASGAEQFCNQIIDACREVVGILKPQVSFFEQFGSVGFAALERVLIRAHNDDFLVIADAKRGDIGSTMNGYAKAWVATDAPFQADAVTVSPFLGPESLGDFCLSAASNQKGVFVLAATSNPEARSSQAASIYGKGTVAGGVASFASTYSDGALGSVGVVLGAETDLLTMGVDPADLLGVPILSPGFGAQGAKLSDAKTLFGPLAPNVIFSVSRSIASNSSDGLRDRVQSAVAELRIGLSN